jgi:iron complex transport system ATP-binding protein
MGEITLLELVSMGRYPHVAPGKRWSFEERQVMEKAVSRTGLHGLENIPVQQLSGGQLQRARIAMSIAQESPIVILDEPTTFLDIRHQEDTLQHLRELNRSSQVTVLMVLHDITQAARYCDELILMDQGRVIAQGAPGTVLTPLRIREIFGVESRRIEDAGHDQLLPVPRLW